MTDWTPWDQTKDTPSFEIPRKTLAHVLSHAQRATAKKNSLPILTYILFAAKGNKVRVSATDLSVGIIVELDAKVTQEGAIALPAKLVTEIVEKMTGDTMVFTSNTKTQTATLKCGRQTSPIKGLAAKEFPPIKHPKRESVLNIPGKTLMDLLTFALHATRTDPVKSYDGAVHLHTKTTGSLIAEAIDDNRMNRAIVPCLWENAINFLIPEGTIRFLLGVFSSDHPIDIVTEEGTFLLLFRQGNVSISTRTIDIAFPDISRMVPQSFVYACMVDSDALRAQVRIASISAKESQNVIRLNLRPNSLEIVAKAPEVVDYQGFLDVETMKSGEPMGDDEVHAQSINVNYLLSVLDAIKTKFLRIEMRTASTPFVFKEVDGRGDNAICLVSPMVNRD